MACPPPLLDVRDLRVDYPGHRRRDRAVRAVDGVSLSIRPGQTLGLVGESGSGKSTIGKAILGLVRPVAGQITFQGEDITVLPPGRRRLLSRHIQVVFQDPYGSLNPARTIGQTIAEPLQVWHRLSRAELDARVCELLAQVGLPAGAMHRYPAQFSGGQRQRIAIARALAPGPRLVVCDEPVSALDVSVQAQVLNLLLELQQRHGLSYLFVSHDMSVVRHVSHRVAVMRAGRIVEEGPVEILTGRPRHPYTRALLAAAPVPDPAEQAARRRRR